MNPYNQQINTAEEKSKYIGIAELKSNYYHPNIKAFINKISRTPDKVFYLGLNMNIMQEQDSYDQANNVQYMKLVQQINNITFSMPQVLALNNWEQIPKVNIFNYCAMYLANQFKIN